MNQTRSLKNLIKIAKNRLEPDTTSLEGFKTFLQTWYVIFYRTSYKDPILLSHTLEELTILYYVNKLSADPHFADKILNGSLDEDEEYEKWLQERMGDNYVSEEEQVDNMVEYIKKEKELAEKLPDRIDTDFSMLGQD